MKLIKIVVILFIVLINNRIYSQCSAKIVCGSYYTFIQKTDGSLLIFGGGSTGALGNMTDTDEYTPFQLSSTTNWQQLSCGAYNTFTINNNGTLWGTGFNYAGELGIGSTVSNLSVLTQIGTASNWKQIAPSNYFTIALKTDNSLWGWGQNDGYQMGDGSCCSNRLSPGQIGIATDWRMAAVSHTRSGFALKNNGTLWCWGTNIAGLLGDNLVTGRAFPTQHNNDTNWQSITVGFAHILALKSNGTLWAWGSDGQGQTANNGTVAYYNPNQIGNSTWKAVAAGQNTSYGIKTDGTLWAWGQNDKGQLGIGITPNQFAPVQVGSDNNWDKIAAGYEHAVALKTNGSLWAWGDNTYGQFGNGTTISSTTPVYIPISGCTLANEEFTNADRRLLLSPNPSKGHVTIAYDSRSEVPVLELYSILGKKITEFKAVSSAGNWELTTSALASGVYIVIMKENGLILTQKKLIVE